jgi:dienelactone hydrolase
MFSEGEIEAKAARVSAHTSAVPGSFSFSAASSFSGTLPASHPASVRASSVTIALLLAEAAAFALAAASDKIPAFLFTAIRALLTF